MTLLIHIVIVLLVLGMILWCIQRIPGLPAPILIAVQIIAVLMCALFILQHAGMVSF